jgi:O-succinylbenzoate synthase
MHQLRELASQMRDAQGGVVELSPAPAVNSISFDQARWSMRTWVVSWLLSACTR